MQVRLLPLLIVAAGLAFTVKVNGLWQGFDAVMLASSADAEEAPPAAPEEAPGAAPEMAREPMAEPAMDGAATPSDDGSGQPGADTATAEGAVRAEDPLDLSDEEILLLQQLSERRTEIERRAREVEQRAVLLEAAEQRIDGKVQELQMLQATIQEMLIQHDEQEETQMRSLVKIYENMKPKEAARIFEQLDMTVLLEVIDRMSERRAAPILAKMNPSKAQEVTIELAQRRELPIAKD
jgi:flagellar motility protein MotE (MotC chaperone)